MSRAWIVVLLAGCDSVFGLEPRAERPPDAPPSGLVAWYPMNDVEMNGLGDATGNGHDAVCVTQCPAPVVGRYGMGRYFDGTDRHLEVPSAVELNTVGGFTLASWVRLEPSLGQFACLFAKQYGTMTANSWELCTSNNDPFFDLGDATLDLMSFGTEWRHAALTWNASTLTAIAYVDGAVVGSEFVMVLFDDNPLTIGADVDFDSAFGFFKGTLDDLRIYDRALSTEEISALLQQP